MTDKTPTQIMGEISALNVALAQAQQPYLAQAVTAMQSEAFQGALNALQEAANGLATTSTVSVQINNLLNIFTNCTTSIAREVNNIQQAASPGPAPGN